MVSTPGETLGRFEFVAACEALLADTPGCASKADLHELFDVLDPQCTGYVSQQEFSRLLQAYQAPPREDGQATACRLLERPEPSVSPVAGLRAWMLQQAWIFQDLEALLGGARAELEWEDFVARLLARVRTPWLTRQGASDIFSQLQVRASDSPTRVVVRVPDLVQVLLGAEDFALEAAKRVLRVLAREARRRGQDVGKLCLAADTKRVGSLDHQQLSSVLSALCPKMLAEADLGLLFWRFSGGSRGFSYEQLQAALTEEQRAAAEHLLLRTWPVLQQQATAFEAAAKAQDTSRSGCLNATQLRAALSQIEVGAGEDLEDLVALMAKACAQDAKSFKYAALVAGGQWKGPSVEGAVAKVCGAKAPAPAATSDGAPRRHLLAILYYKTAEASKKLGLSLQRAFEGLDRGNKGFLSAEDLRGAVLQAVGGDESLTLKDLGLAPGTRLTAADFERRLDFDFGPLRHVQEVFADQAVVKESDFASRLQQLGVDKATSQTWLQLMYPAGVPAEGVGRGACEIFLATTPAVNQKRWVSLGCQDGWRGPENREFARSWRRAAR
ncbi:unnamed protein product [Effrenium voratum]|nr:unnamed protein product [Effrenium voratum]